VLVGGRTDSPFGWLGLNPSASSVSYLPGGLAGDNGRTGLLPRHSPLYTCFFDFGAILRLMRKVGRSQNNQTADDALAENVTVVDFRTRATLLAGAVRPPNIFSCW
jgi:hypothetical protein